MKPYNTMFAVGLAFASFSVHAFDNCQAVPAILDQMAKEDQSIRYKADRLKPDDYSLNPEMARLNLANTTKLKEIVKQCGWPTVEKYGYEPAHNAWLIAQHSDQDIQSQIDVRAILRPLAIKGAASRKEFAYLSDRIELQKSGKQKYGSQLMFLADRVILPPEEIDSIEEVNNRRAEIGLDSIEEYLRQANERQAKIRNEINAETNTKENIR
jgi:hypothetical protein